MSESGLRERALAAARVAREREDAALREYQERLRADARTRFGMTLWSMGVAVGHDAIDVAVDDRTTCATVVIDGLTICQRADGQETFGPFLRCQCPGDGTLEELAFGGLADLGRLLADPPSCPECGEDLSTEVKADG